jgi:hypothetical protein
MIKVTLIGANGRMGEAIQACARSIPELRIVATADQGDSLQSAIEQGDVVIEFSHHTVSKEASDICSKFKKPLIIGSLSGILIVGLSYLFIKLGIQWCISIIILKLYRAKSFKIS